MVGWLGLMCLQSPASHLVPQRGTQRAGLPRPLWRRAGPAVQVQVWECWDAVPTKPQKLTCVAHRSLPAPSAFHWSHSAEESYRVQPGSVKSRDAPCHAAAEYGAAFAGPGHAIHTR